MKISNSKKELARIISEKGGWRDGEFAAQDGDGSVAGYGEKPEWNSGSRYWWRKAVGWWFSANKVKNHHRTVLSRAEYLHLYPAPDADGWIEWKGGECPVEKGTVVDVIWRNGTERAGVKALHIGGAGHKFWVADGMANYIIAYRPHKPEQAGATDKLSSEAVSAAKIALMSDSIEELVRKPTIEQLAADYRNAKDYADRKQQEADDAKADVGAKLKALKLAGKEHGLLVSPITAKQDPELVITDWRNLQVGDEISVQHMKNVYSKSEVLVVGNSEVSIRNHAGARKTVNLDEVDWKFIRRP